MLLPEVTACSSPGEHGLGYVAPAAKTLHYPLTCRPHRTYDRPVFLFVTWVMRPVWVRGVWGMLDAVQVGFQLRCFGTGVSSLSLYNTHASAHPAPVLCGFLAVFAAACPPAAPSQRFREVMILTRNVLMLLTSRFCPRAALGTGSAAGAFCAALHWSRVLRAVPAAGQCRDSWLTAGASWGPVIISAILLWYHIISAISIT